MIFEEGKRLSVKLVSAFIRRQELRGSDVRLDVGSLYRPEAFPRGSIDPTKWLEVDTLIRKISSQPTLIADG